MMIAISFLMFFALVASWLIAPSTEPGEAMASVPAPSPMIPTEAAA